MSVKRYASSSRDPWYSNIVWSATTATSTQCSELVEAAPGDLRTLTLSSSTRSEDPVFSVVKLKFKSRIIMVYIPSTPHILVTSTARHVYV